MKKTLLSFLKEEENNNIDSTESMNPNETSSNIQGTEKSFKPDKYYIFLGRPSLINGKEFGSIEFLHSFVAGQGQEVYCKCLNEDSRAEENEGQGNLIPIQYFLNAGILFDTHKTVFDDALSLFKSFKSSILSTILGKQAILSVIINPIKTLGNVPKVGIPESKIIGLENWGASHSLVRSLKQAFPTQAD